MYRRDFLFGAAALMANGPKVEAIAAGDPLPGRALIWARADRSAQMVVKWKAASKSGTVRGQAASAASDFTARTDIGGLPAGEIVNYTVHFEEGKTLGAPADGSFRSIPGAGRDVSFLWSGDMVGQGWGIHPDHGIKLFDTMRRREADFFIHSGDTIYADGPIEREVKLPDGSAWKNVVTEAKSKVAESLDEFRGCHKYNLMDENVRRFAASTAQIWQWDDHEVMNNWSPGKDLKADNRYKEKDIRKIVARARQAFLEYAPIRFADLSSARIHRRIPYGPLLDVFVIDMRTFRAANNPNLQTDRSGETDYLGGAQLEWLKRDLKRSRATWKVIASDMPLGLIVPDGKDKEGRSIYENSANGDGPALGRELEIAELLKFIKTESIHNVVWFTADVHYTAAHFYDPEKAQFRDFAPFWEFVSGPMNAGTFGPGSTDNTFGIQVVYQKHPPKGRSNLSPAEGMQFFGEVRIGSKDRAMTVTLRDQDGADLFTKRLEAAA